MRRSPLDFVRTGIFLKLQVLPANLTTFRGRVEGTDGSRV